MDNTHNQLLVKDKIERCY